MGEGDVVGGGGSARADGGGADGVLGGLGVVRRTDRYVVVEKPSGLLSVPGKGPDKTDCVVARVRGALSGATGPMVVHRLDMDTSGLMVVALDADAQRDLSLQFERRKTFKRYEALLRGRVGMRSGGVDHSALDGASSAGWAVVDCAIRVDPENRPYQVHDAERGKASRTRYRLVGHERLAGLADGGAGGVVGGSGEVGRESGGVGWVSRVEFEPETGRSHQLRVHSAFGREVGGIGHAIVGDPLYGPDGDGVGRDGDGGARLMLHATALGFTEPGTDRWVVCRSVCPF